MTMVIQLRPSLTSDGPSVIMEKFREENRSI